MHKNLKMGRRGVWAASTLNLNDVYHISLNNILKLYVARPRIRTTPVWAINGLRRPFWRRRWRLRKPYGWYGRWCRIIRFVTASRRSFPRQRRQRRRLGRLAQRWPYALILREVDHSPRVARCQPRTEMGWQRISGKWSSILRRYSKSPWMGHDLQKSRMATSRRDQQRCQIYDNRRWKRSQKHWYRC